jgi:hypothetical protein
VECLVDRGSSDQSSAEGCEDGGGTHLELFLGVAGSNGSGSLLRMFTFFEKVRSKYSRYGDRSLKGRKIEGVRNWQHCCTYDSSKK